MVPRLLCHGGHGVGYRIESGAEAELVIWWLDDLPAHDEWVVHVLIPHGTKPKAGATKAHIMKQLPSTTLLYYVQTPIVVVTRSTKRKEYCLQSTHDHSPNNFYTFTTYLGLQPPQHHTRCLLNMHPLPWTAPPSTQPAGGPVHNTRIACSDGSTPDLAPSPTPPRKAPRAHCTTIAP